MKVLFFLLTTLFFASCNQTVDDIYFNGKVTNIKCDSVYQHIKAQSVFSPEFMYQFEPIVYDNLIIGQLYNQNFIFEVTNINTGESLGKFVSKGNARNEMISPSIVKNAFIENNEIKVLVKDVDKKLSYKWNVTKSIEQNITVFDFIVDYEDDSASDSYHYSTLLDESKLLGYTQAFNVTENQKCPERPVLVIKDVNSSEVYNEYYVFKKTFDNRTNEAMASEDFFYSDTKERPDKKYVVQAMWFLPQINIINLETEKIKGFRLDKGLDFSIFNTPSLITHIYFCSGIHTTNDKIFVGYRGVTDNKSKEIYVFDWNGKLLKACQLDIEYDKILSDPITNKQYVYQADTGEIFKVELDV
ncbi:MAG: hypothetical protein R3Y26_05900 [Rikenellaceae bacterium]